jgi:ubiquinone/menaquinone biosynthesis C-methylase UbiE
MDELQLLIDLHKDGRRQGPGGEAETELALALTGVDRRAPLHVADIGCGTGASTLVLARLLERGRVTAVDFLPQFLDLLEERAGQAGMVEKISTLACSMDDLPFADGELDLIWSEGAIYNIGFAAGVKAWKRYLKPGGVLVASEITWLTDSRPAELQAHWDAEYPEIDTAAAKIRILEQSGYAPIGYFVLPEYCWLENYFRPLQERFPVVLARYGDSREAREMVAAEEREIALYEQYKTYFSYGVYIARRVV